MNGLSLVISKGECFGLLGVNGKHDFDSGELILRVNTCMQE